MISVALAILVTAATLGALGACLGLAARLLPAAADDALVDRVNQLLPQTQCAQCGYPGCRPYAAAVVAGAPLNGCPPGGEQTVAALSDLLGRPVEPLIAPPPAPAIAWIDPSRCIGCVLCLPACPVDAIVGAPGYQHGVLDAHCTGCELCIAPCPVDCISMLPDPEHHAPVAPAPGTAEPRTATLPGAASQ